jgi:DNA replication and repair protein RecF
MVRAFGIELAGSKVFLLILEESLHIKHLSLSNFRNYRHLEMDIPSHLMVLQGDNAQGKTNLLEAIWVLATTKSHHTANERELVSRAAAGELLPVARLFAEVERCKDNISLELSLKLDKGDGTVSSESTSAVRKRIRVNGVVRHAIDVVGQIKAVMFTAQDIELISGAPSLRRRYLDLINSQVDPSYLRSLQQYHKVLWQRNRLLGLLQQRHAQIDQLEFWNRELVGNGSYLIMQRRNLVAMLNELLPPIHGKLSGGTEELGITYLSSVGGEWGSPGEVGTEFQKALSLSLDKEIAQGMSLVGPHRDDIQFQADDVNMGTYGSRGQQRTIALSLRLAEAKYLQAQAGDQPILLLDDMLSELDQPRRHHLLQFITSFQQVLITATDLDHFEPSFLAQATQFRVRQGNVKRI